MASFFVVVTYVFCYNMPCAQLCANIASVGWGSHGNRADRRQTSEQGENSPPH